MAQIKSRFWKEISRKNLVHTESHDKDFNCKWHKLTFNNLFDSQQQNKNTSKYITDMLLHNDLKFYLEDAKQLGLKIKSFFKQLKPKKVLTSNVISIQAALEMSLTTMNIIYAILQNSNWVIDSEKKVCPSQFHTLAN